eukprot:Tbor_TRINITY_DN5489_c1_g1::TRINITY_DN5489_c1_g1_i1::g.24468::m.24468
MLSPPPPPNSYPGVGAARPHTIVCCIHGKRRLMVDMIPVPGGGENQYRCMQRKECRPRLDNNVGVAAGRQQWSTSADTRSVAPQISALGNSQPFSQMNNQPSLPPPSFPRPQMSPGFTGPGNTMHNRNGRMYDSDVWCLQHGKMIPRSMCTLYTDIGEYYLCNRPANCEINLDSPRSLIPKQCPSLFCLKHGTIRSLQYLVRVHHGYECSIDHPCVGVASPKVPERVQVSRQQQQQLMQSHGMR